MKALSTNSYEDVFAPLKLNVDRTLSFTKEFCEVPDKKICVFFIQKAGFGK